MTYDTYIFDMDGTILNTIDDLADAVNYAMTKMGYSLHSVSEVKGFVGNGIKKLIERAVPAGTGDQDRDRAYQYFTEFYSVHCKDKTGPYPGILELLRTLKDSGKKLAVVSNKADYAVQILADEVFPGLFDTAIGEQEGINKKPARDMVDLALERLGASNEELRKKAVYIGDSNVDFETSVNSELDCILVTWGFRDKEVLKDFNARYMVDSPEEILNI